MIPVTTNQICDDEFIDPKRFTIDLLQIYFNKSNGAKAVSHDPNLPTVWFVSSHFSTEAIMFTAYHYRTQRAEAASLIKPRMQKQYRPFSVPNSSLPFSLPFLNAKSSIHDVKHTLHTRRQCAKCHTPVFWWCSQVSHGFFHGRFTHCSRTFHTSKWTKNCKALYCLN